MYVTLCFIGLLYCILLYFIVLHYIILYYITLWDTVVYAVRRSPKRRYAAHTCITKCPVAEQHILRRLLMTDRPTSCNKEARPTAE